MKISLSSWGVCKAGLFCILVGPVLAGAALSCQKKNATAAAPEEPAPLAANTEAALDGAPEAAPDAEPAPQPEARIVLDGDTAEWPADAAVIADEHYLYFRFAVENEEFALQASPHTLAVQLDLDASTASGRIGAAEPTADMGVDIELQFSPYTPRGVERGVAMYAMDRTGNRTKLNIATFDFSFAPSCASTWYEARLTRTPAALGNLPRAGLFSSGAVKGVITMLSSRGEIDAWSDPFTLNLGRACPGGKRLSGLEAPPRPDGSIRIVSWNVKRSAPVSRPEPFKHVLQALNPDIILIQEWESGDAAAMQGWFTAMLPSETTWNVRKRTGGLEEGGGVAIVSRFPMVPLLGDTLAVANEGERTARPIRYIGSRISTPYGELYAASTHLKCCGAKDSPEDKRRLLEARTINANFAAACGSAPPGSMRVIAGDLNLVGSRPPLDVIRALADCDRSELAIANALTLGDRTYATWRDASEGFSPGRLDYVLFSDGCAQAVNAFVLDTSRLSDEALALMGLSRTDTDASDHLPVVVDLMPIAK